MLHRGLALLLLVVLLGGCSSRSVFGGTQTGSKYSDVFYTGKIQKGSLAESPRSITLVSSQGRFRCNGQLIAINPGEGINCDGMYGEDVLRCADGDTLTLKWHGLGCDRGIGEGVFASGVNLDTFSFGFPSYRAATVADNEYHALDGQKHEADASQATPSSKGKAKGKLIGRGSGFFISDDGLLITNFHVVEGASKFEVCDTHSRQSYPAELLAVDRANDLALLKIKAKTQGLPLSVRGISKGQDIMALGYPLVDLQGIEQKATFGRINSLTGIHNESNIFQMDVPIQKGNSGGPVLNMYGEVVGVASSGIDSAKTIMTMGTAVQNANYAVKVDYIQALMKAQRGYTLRPAKGQRAANMEELVRQCEESVVMMEIFK